MTKNCYICSLKKKTTKTRKKHKKYFQICLVVSTSGGGHLYSPSACRSSCEAGVVGRSDNKKRKNIPVFPSFFLLGFYRLCSSLSGFIGFA